MSVIIKSVLRHSYAERAGLEAGDTLVSINDNEIVDVLDYRFYQLQSRLTLEIRDQKGEVHTVKLRKPEYEELGLTFDSYLMDREKSCKNKCVFCFIDQLPKGMRESLYFKDDDSRLSFLFGNYITLTNLTEHEVSRIIKMHISPINVSVHTTNPELRCRMMNNRFAGERLSLLKRFSDSGIVLNTQIVCCPSLNDGDELKRSLSDLKALGANLIAVVPVGITKYREGLYPLTPFTKEKAGETIDIIERFGERCLKECGSRVAYAADELYLIARRPIPEPAFYGDFEAIENGVGMIAMLKEDVLLELEDAAPDQAIEREISVACGTAVAPYLEEILNSIKEKYPRITIHLYPIRNEFFGETITVSGLIVGNDLIGALKGKPLGEELLISSNMLRFENDLFLDDVHIDDASKKLSVKITPVNTDGRMLIDAVLGRL